MHKYFLNNPVCSMVVICTEHYRKPTGFTFNKKKKKKETKMKNQKIKIRKKEDKTKLNSKDGELYLCSLFRNKLYLNLMCFHDN